VDDLLSILPAQLGPAHRWRKIKGAAPLVPTVQTNTRSYARNNGHVEIDPSPDDGAEEKTGFFEETQYGRTYKLPEEGVKLDFISK
jgi:hypothetical protein